MLTLKLKSDISKYSVGINQTTAMFNFLLSTTQQQHHCLSSMCILDGQQHDLIDISHSHSRFCASSIGTSAPPALDKTVTLPTTCHYWTAHKLSLSRGPILNNTWSNVLESAFIVESFEQREQDSICKHYVLWCTTSIFFNLLQGILSVVYGYEGMPRHCATLRAHNRFYIAWLWRVWQLCRRVLGVLITNPYL